MAESSKRLIVTRREALILSATAGLGIAAGREAHMEEPEEGSE